MYDQKNLADILIEEIVELHTVERQFLQALPRMAQVACDPELKAAVNKQLLQTRSQVGQLARIMDMLGITDECAGVRVVSLLIGEDDIWMEESHSHNAMDARIICTAMKVEHFKMGSYLSLYTFASLLGLDEVSDALKQAFPRNSFFCKRLEGVADAAGDRETMMPLVTREKELLPVGLSSDVN
jgi:ferritin-like metal-binding protein YciE